MGKNWIHLRDGSGSDDDEKAGRGGPKHQKISRKRMQRASRPGVPKTFAVNKAALSITASDQEKIFQQAKDLGTTDFTTSGLVGSDSISSVTLTSTGSGASAPAGAYPIVPSAAVAGGSTDLSNYSISYVNGTLTVNKADQTISFSSLADRTYGDPDGDLSATASSGLTVSFGASGACSIVAGKVHITGAGSCTVTASQAGDSDYKAATPVQQSFSIARALLTITAGDQQKITRFALNLGTTLFTTSPLVGSDSISAVTLTSSGASAGASAGNYPIVPSGAVGGGATDPNNYSITYVNGNLAVLNAGFVGLNGVSIVPNGSSVDSFDSSAGLYGGSNQGSAALVLSNGTVSIGHVVLHGDVLSTQGGVRFTTSTAHVTGDVTAGGAVSGPGLVDGTVTQNAPSPAISAPTVAACSPYSNKSGISGGSFTYSAGNLTVVSGTVTLANGAYCFHNITLGTGTTLHQVWNVYLRR